MKLLRFPFFLSMANFFVWFQNYFLIILIKVKVFDGDDDLKLIRLGSSYGGWFVPEKLVSKEAAKKVLVSVGLGHDVSFDEEMAKRDFAIIGLDPLIKCCSLAEKQLNNYPNVKIINKGLWSYSGEVKFYSPKVKSHDSWSISNAHHSREENSQLFKVISLGDLIQENTLINMADISVLKIDVEGAEVEILRSLVAHPFRFDFLAVEFDYLSLIPFANFIERLQKYKECKKLIVELQEIGYQFIKNENFNFFFTSNKRTNISN